MYIPKINEENDNAALMQFMQQYSFATIINSKDNIPVATHLPFIISQEKNTLKLISHFAKANKQWELINDSQSLIIFSEPHAYISPTHYDNELSVPTWNYISVHAYGTGKLIKNKEDVQKVLEQTITTFERSYKQQWDQLPENFKGKMTNGIVAFEILVTELQGKKKLSQNKTEAEQRRIIDTISNSELSTERDIATYMQQNLNNHL